MTGVRVARHARRAQARLNRVRRLSRVPGALHAIKAAQRWPLTAAAYRACVGFYRPFASLEEANTAVAPYADAGHENRSGAALHLTLNERARPSDYAAMSHLRTILTDSFRIFDFGGNVGNLFRCFSSYIDIPPGLVWQSCDLASVVAHGRELAAECGLSQLCFTEDWQDASGADLLLASGSLHYIDTPLPQLLDKLREKPRYILINRTPLTDGAPVAMVQDGPGYRVACMLHNRRDLLGGLQAIGYELMDAWDAPELSISIVGYPEHAVSAYSGLFLRHRGMSCKR